MSTIYNPLNEVQTKALEELTTQLNKEGVIWVNGYFQGMLSVSGNGTSKLPENQENDQEVPGFTILYGTHTGHSQKIAGQLSEAAANLGIITKVFSMDDYKVKQLSKEENVAIIVSTHGEGEAPDMAEDFYTYVTGKRAPKLPKLNYSVLALGDKSYKLFCQTGIDIDNALKKAGGNDLQPVVLADVDYEDDAEQWINSYLEKIKDRVPVANASLTMHQVSLKEASYSKKSPFYAEILDKVKITGRDSDKEVYHLELSLEESGIAYQPGDSVGILANNPPLLVENIITISGFNPEEKIKVKDGEVTIKEALSNHFEITVLNQEVIKKYAEKVGSKELEKLFSDDKKLDDYLYGHDILDLLELYPHDWKPEGFFQLLRKFPARMYSISSSQDAVEDEVHITVSVVKYENKGRKRLGACSTFLSEISEIGDKIPIYIDHNPSFKLPVNEDTPIIMVGAGTGVAPYRAFLQQRESVNQKGKSWLVFGERRFYSDFLYQVEWQKLLKKGYLEKLDVAFSRDQKEKIYVQDKLKEKQEEVYNWLENGASFYLCGDMKYMAKDVNKTLLEIIQTQGGITEEKAKEYIKKLKKEKRFQVDVY